MLKKKFSETVKERTLDELDEYVMLLESHRIKLVSKLKAVFDRFDSGWFLLLLLLLLFLILNVIFYHVIFIFNF
jgi:hypothetical protein